MERRTFTSNQKPLPNSPQNFLTTPTPSQTRAWFVGAVFVILVLLGIGIFFVLQQQRQEIERAEKLAAITPTSVPTPTPASPSADFVFYKDLPGEEKFAVAYNFTDPVLGVGFAYPPGYNVQSYKADKENKLASLYFLSFKNSALTPEVAKIIQCNLDNRKKTVNSAVCTSTLIGDVEVTIYPYVKSTFNEENDANCRKEITTKNRLLFSCEFHAFDKKGTKGMRYALYLLGENPMLVDVYSKTPKEQAHLIRSIISSTTNSIH